MVTAAIFGADGSQIPCWLVGRLRISRKDLDDQVLGRESQPRLLQHAKRHLAEDTYDRALATECSGGERRPETW